MRGMNRLNRMLFFIFSGRRHQPTAQYGPRQKRLEVAEQAPRVQELFKNLQERKDERDTAIPVPHIGRSVWLPFRGRIRVLAQPSDSGNDTDRGSVHPDGGEQPPVIEHANNWETLEKRLLEMVKDNPDITEVELKNDTTE